jgi:hypothetical protein
VALCLVGIPSLGCDGGVRGRTGLEALLRASGGTFVDQPIPTADDPTVSNGPLINVGRYPSTAQPGQVGLSFAGILTQGGRSVAVGLADDRAYWIIPAPSVNQEVGSKGELLFSANLSFSPLIAPGTHNLVMRAVGADGRMGSPTIAPVMIASFANVRGAFQIKLLWDTNADLDLHVIVPVDPKDLIDPADPKAPKTIEVWNNQPSSLPPRPIFEPYTAEEIMNGGLLDYDSNAGCVIDGRREENIVWGAGPLPAGDYIVRVDTVSLCGEVDAQWQLDVFRDGNSTPIMAAYGEAVDTDTRFSHTQGAGVLALKFTLP